ncbi:hypothetical protein AJ79_04884 [Helicocarpus griseus UAMH5409]|uniref:Uncharacterized protein n=1 Tax=Helicocarpus griseus UAMH5409 TaxID=1447875 RepID=A0A2B7XRJ9_9EURO|nr:hypothetical protein AJ79_04884 [Helicocarpus griseus UAMH5409]
MSDRHNSSNRRPAGSPFGRSPIPRIRTPSGRSKHDYDNASAATSPLSSPLSPCPPSQPTPAFCSPLPLRRGSRPNNDTSSLSPVPQFTSDGFHSDTTVRDSLRPSQADGPARATSSFNGSFNSFSQRIVRDGEVIVTNSDEDTDSLSDLDTDDLLAKFLKPTSAAKPKGDNGSGTASGSRRRRYSGSLKLNYPKNPPKYQFSLDTLVQDAADDKETEAKVAKIKQSFQPSVPPEKRGGALRDEVLASAVEDETDTKGIQRLRDAVERTETFAMGRSWLFFEEDSPAVPQPEFPSELLQPGSWEDTLKDPSSRGRAFFTGVVADSLSSKSLPDEMMLWILRTIPTEEDDYLRQAYSCILKRATTTRILSLLKPRYIDRLFRRLGAKPAALSLSRSLEPEYLISEKYKTRDNRFLLSVLETLHGLAEKLNDATREHFLKIVLRLSIDEAIMTDCLVCLEVQNILTTLLGNPERTSSSTLHGISTYLYETIDHVELQTQLLKAILPTTPRLALFRCRLAWAFFFRDPTLLNRPRKHLLDLPRLTKHLRDDPRFDTNARSKTPFNFWELHALTTILDIAIDSGTARPTFKDRQRENEFNAAVDALSDRVKAIFSAIRDSGASHLRRSEAKDSLQALHCRLVFGVRTRPKPARSMFVREAESGGKRMMERRFLVKEEKKEGRECPYYTRKLRGNADVDEQQI